MVTIEELQEMHLADDAFQTCNYHKVPVRMCVANNNTPNDNESNCRHCSWVTVGIMASTILGGGGVRTKRLRYIYIYIYTADGKNNDAVARFFESKRENENTF